MKLIFPKLRALTIAVVVFTTASCGFHLRSSFNLPEEIQTLSLTSFDPYDDLTRQMAQQLKLHHLNVVAPDEGIPNIHIKGESYGETTLSLYQNSRVAEKQFRYTVNYSVQLPRQGSFDFSTSLSRTYLDNPLTALAKSVEQEMLIQEMQVEASKQIMRQLARLNAHVAEFKAKELQDRIMRELYQQSENSQQPSGIRIKTRLNPNPEKQSSSDDIVPNNTEIKP